MTTGTLGFEVVSEDQKRDLFRKQLQGLADELRALDRAAYNATLEKGKLLAKVMDEGLYRRDPEYRASHYKKAKDGALAATAAWAKREVGPHFTLGRTSQLIRAHRVFTSVKTADPAPTSEGQLRPLAKLWPDFKDKIPQVWEKAVEAAGGEQPGQGQVAKVAREVAPEAFPKKGKRKPSARSALKNLIDQYGRAAIERALKDLK